MKRAALVGLAALLAMGVVAWGQVPPPPTDSETRTSTFTIPPTIDVFTVSGDLDFGLVVAPADPAIVGDFDSSIWNVQINANVPFGAVWTGTAFVHATLPVSLPTALRIATARLIGATWIPTVPPVTPWLSLPRTNVPLPFTGIGSFRAAMQLRVTRAGFFDPAGTYEATVTITATGL